MVTEARYNTENFLEERARNEELEVDDTRMMIYKKKGLYKGQFINFVNRFNQLGGFQSLLDLIKNGNVEQGIKVPFDIIPVLTQPFKNMGEILKPDFAKSFVVEVKETIFQRFQSLTEKELREIDKDIVSTILREMRDFLLLALSEEEADKAIETTQLLMSLRFLNSQSLEKRLKGIMEIKGIVERTEAPYKYRTSMSDVSLQRSKWLTSDFLSEWVLKHEVLDIILSLSLIHI